MDQASPMEHLSMRLNDIEAQSRVRIDPTSELERRVAELETQIKQMDGVIHALYREVFNLPEP